MMLGCNVYEQALERGQRCSDLEKYYDVCRLTNVQACALPTLNPDRIQPRYRTLSL